MGRAVQLPGVGGRGVGGRDAEGPGAGAGGPRHLEIPYTAIERVDSPYVNRKFAEDCGAPFPILSDFNREATDAYGVRRELGGLEGVSERAAFVVDPAGIVRYVWVGEHPGVFPPLEEIREAARRAGRGGA